MISIAIIEDNERDAQALEDCLTRFQNEEGKTIRVTRFSDGMQLIESKRFDFDILYMDIEMPLLNGMDTAEALRKEGCSSILVFVTNMAQYAIHGYRVEAADFVLKPIRYASFSTMLKKLLSRIEKEEGNEIALISNKGMKKLSLDSVRYIESEGHKLTFHTESGETEDWGSMKKVLDTLPADRFVRCNNSYIVNLGYIREIKVQSVLLDNGDELIISRNRRKALLEAYRDYLLHHGVSNFL